MKRKAFEAALPKTLPICVGFLFLGVSYGLFMQGLGFSFWYPMVMSLLIYAGSMEFITANLLLGAFNPLQAFLLTLMVNARHLFYGLSMLDKYRNKGWKTFYLIFGMCDESFSINCAVSPPVGVDRGWFMLFVTLLNHLYWVAGATMGGLLGGWLTLNLEGISFVMTALFVVLFLEQWKDERGHRAALVGVGCSVLCLLLFGGEWFLIPTMVVLVALFALQHIREKKAVEQCQ